jgi:predicted MFS family arabinose efflux permease
MSADLADAPPRGLRPLTKDGYLAAFLLALLTTAGLFYVNIMAAIVTGLSDGLGFSLRDAGLVGSANVFGAAAGSLVAVFLVKRLPWRRTAAMLLTVLLGLDLLSILVETPALMIGLRFLHGVVGGCSVGIGLSVIARTAVPDRAFAMLLAVQYGFGGLGVMVLPGLVPLFGTKVLFLSLAAFTSVALALLPFLPPYPRREVAVLAPGAVPARIRRLPLILTCAAMFLFQTANMAIAAYGIELGRHYGLTQSVIGPALGIAGWTGILGAVLVMMLAGKFGRVWPLVGVYLATMAGTWAYFGSEHASIYFIASMVTSITWAFAIPYIYGMSAEFDTAGQTTALAGFFSKLGLATGPALGAFILVSNNYALLIHAAVAGILLSGAAALLPAILSDRAKRLGS